jgi:hypothetical protein
VGGGGIIPALRSLGLSPTLGSKQYISKRGRLEHRCVKVPEARTVCNTGRSSQYKSGEKTITDKVVP